MLPRECEPPLTIFLHVEHVGFRPIVGLHANFVGPFNTLGDQGVRELQDFTTGCLVQPLSDSVTMGILSCEIRSRETTELECKPNFAWRLDHSDLNCEKSCSSTWQTANRKCFQSAFLFLFYFFIYFLFYFTSFKKASTNFETMPANMEPSMDAAIMPYISGWHFHIQRRTKKNQNCGLFFMFSLYR